MSGKKMQGFSKSYASGFVSDYRHAVNNVDVSEGLGSSGRFEADSEDSSSPNKRKCISLNNNNQRSDIPREVFKLSKMSRSERERLRMRLGTELNRVQNINKNFCARFGNAASVATERFASVKQGSLPGYPTSLLMKRCGGLLEKLMKHHFGWVFNKPVDVVKLNIPDYFTIIKHPMDFGTIKKKLASGQYSHPLGFHADVKLTFDNATTYNPPTDDVHIMAKGLCKFFDAGWKYIERKLPKSDSGQIASRPNVSKPVDANSNISRGLNAPKATSPFRKRKISSVDVEIKKKRVKKIWTEAEKHTLTRDLDRFTDNLPQHIIDFLREQNCREGQSVGDEEMEVDIDVYGDDALCTLRKFVDELMKEKQRTGAKVVPCELEDFNETRHKRTSIEPCKGDEPDDMDVDIDGDVDIGENDPPVTSYPPVEIEKNTTHRSSRHSSPSSSSSDSSSSSSDSDTDSSSSRDTDGASASSPINTMQEVQSNNHGHSQNGNKSVSELDQFDRNPRATSVSSEVDSRQVESNDLTGRLISPDRQYRKALLKSRFADTILKAQVKTLDQGEKMDPEKLQREWEELERKQREERIRLQAEARAAEDARKKNEADAAKRKRELDREAARRALLEMEKTVETNENCNFLEDLEMLSTADPPQIPLSDATSPDQGSVELSGFKLQGSNPLEQLGLYMKMDDDEEE